MPYRNFFPADIMVHGCKCYKNFWALEQKLTQIPARLYRSTLYVELLPTFYTLYLLLWMSVSH